MKKYLNIGCGKLHEKSTDEIQWINIDQFEEVEPDLIHDMTKKFPFEDNSIDHIQAIACLGQIESNKDFLFTMNEFWRLLKPEGTIFILLPHRDYPHSYLDPFNQRRTNELHWQGFDKNSLQYTQHNHYYGFLPWESVRIGVEKGFLSIWMTKSIK